MTVLVMSVGGVLPPTRPYVEAASVVEMDSCPKLKAALRNGFGFGVKAFTAATTTFTQRATPTPNRTYAATLIANDIEIALERKSMTGFRWAAAAKPSKRTNMSGSRLATFTPSDAATRHAAPAATTAPMYTSAKIFFMRIPSLFT